MERGSASETDGSEVNTGSVVSDTTPKKFLIVQWIIVRATDYSDKYCHLPCLEKGYLEVINFVGCCVAEFADTLKERAVFQYKS